MAASFIRVFSEGQGYRTIPLKEGMSAAEVASQVIKVSPMCTASIMLSFIILQVVLTERCPGSFENLS